MRILLIDDNPDDRLLTRREIERHFPRFTIQDIASGPEFMGALEAGSFDLVITDFELRWSNGITILDSVKERYPDCHVIMFTATGTQEVAVAAMKAGLDDYVIKAPHHFIRLTASIQSVIQRHAAQRHLRSLEQRLEILLSRLEIGAFRLSAAGRLLEANEGLLSLLGLTSIDEARALDLTPLLGRSAAATTANTRAVVVGLGGGRQVRLLVATAPADDDMVDGVARRAD
jgi:DNA-binding NtrC family response regulator